MNIPAELASNTLRKAIGRYYKELADYESKGGTELNLRPAFQNLLAEMARRVNLTLVHEMTIRGRIRPDGVLVNSFNIRRGYWEAKGPKGNLEAEIEQKKRDGYPLENALFENTRQAVLFQGGQRFDFDMKVIGDVTAMLQKFLTYQKPETANFEQAVLDFKEQIPNIATRLLELINTEHTRNARFITAFNTFSELCRTTLNPKISADEIKEMLVQHLLTERLFRTVFDNPDFVNKNVIAVEIERVIQALTSRSFNRSEFLRELDPFYGAIEGAARGIETWGERQSFLNTVYERFFQGFAVQKADTLGIVYTPQEIVDFMVASVDEVLKREFGKGLATPGVKILDPAVGTGNFIVNIIKHIPRAALREKYTGDLFCNEIALLPYYIASLNIEHEYYAKMHEYLPFEGVCFVDTLELAEGQQLPLWMVEENTERIKREKGADIMVVIGNPPYNVGQVNENDNNKNRKYPVIDQQIKETYARASKASNKNALSDMYVKFFRWATDRLQGRDGIVCLVTNNSFVDQIAFDGMRQHLLKDFTQIYHLDLHGNVRKNPRISGTKHNVFGIQVGVGITLAIRSTRHTDHSLYYHRVQEDWTKLEKLDYLTNQKNIDGVDWLQLKPDAKYTWITEGLHPEFATYLAMGDKVAKSVRNDQARTLFKLYSGGVKTNRDDWAYGFSKTQLTDKIQRFITIYNSEVDRWNRRSNDSISVDDFITYNDQKIKWSRDLKLDLQRGHYADFSMEKLRTAIYRPFCKQWLFFDRILNEEVYQLPKIFPTLTSEEENFIIYVAGIGADHQVLFAARCIVDIKCGISGNSTTQCFPYYTYAEDGSNRRENITDWALERFQAKYGAEVSKWDIFHYVYAMLHHPGYRERYAENLKRDLPHIPLVRHAELFQAMGRIGRALLELHINYEQQPEYPLTPLEDETVPYAQLTYVEKMKLTPDRTALVVSKGLTLAGIPAACYSYRLGNRSALEWVIDQYQITKDARSGIVSNPNRTHDPAYIVRLVKQVVTVSLRTVELVTELAQTVSVEDWSVEE
ncbi:MAG TPA: type ISP restriction/modification enzyme [Ktedonobacteraceae bacterium]|nr:type ISP restriction/modification enzyme [Ktedonobacteraceae bacterium]